MNRIHDIRYADNLTFSANSVEKLPRLCFVRKIVDEEQFELNPTKSFQVTPMQGNGYTTRDSMHMQ